VAGDFLALVPLVDIGLDLGLDPLANFVTESGMGFVEVGRGVLLNRKQEVSLGVLPDHNFILRTTLLTPWYHEGSAKGTRSP